MNKFILFALVSFSLLINAEAKNPAHHTGSMTIQGPWNLKAEAIEDKYGVPVARYGTFEIIMPDGEPAKSADGQPAVLREFHYKICSTESSMSTMGGRDNGVQRCVSDAVGVRPIPVVDASYKNVDDAPVETVTAAWDNSETVEVKGSEVLDTFLAQVFRFQNDGTPADDAKAKDQPIYSIIAYSLPEITMADFMSISDSGNLKTENGITHMGAYIGNGQTRNSPTGYHGDTWGHQGYPPVIYTVR